jgi:hypothetical protein
MPIVKGPTVPLPLFSTKKNCVTPGRTRRRSSFTFRRVSGLRTDDVFATTRSVRCVDA